MFRFENRDDAFILYVRYDVTDIWLNWCCKVLALILLWRWFWCLIFFCCYYCCRRCYICKTIYIWRALSLSLRHQSIALTKYIFFFIPCIVSHFHWRIWWWSFSFSIFMCNTCSSGHRDDINAIAICIYSIQVFCCCCFCRRSLDIFFF